MNKDRNTVTHNARRRLLKTTLIAGSTYSILLDKWVKPVVNSVILPAHAQTSASTTASPATTANPTTTASPTTTATPPGITTAAPCIPDLTPTISINPSDIIGPTQITIILSINEITGCATDGSDITVLLSADPRLTIQSTSSSGFPFNLVSSGSIIRFDGSGVFPAGGSASIMVSANFVPVQATQGSTEFTVTIPFNGQGGETNTSNNSSTATLTYDSVV